MHILKMKIQVLNLNTVLKVNDCNSVSLDHLLSILRKKFEADLDILGPMKYLLDDVTVLSKKINEGETEIHHSLEILKNKEDEVGEFIFELNKIKTSEMSTFDQ